MKRIYLSLFAMSILLMGCNSNQDGLINDEELVDSLNFENWMDASITEDELSVDIVSNDPDVQEAHAEIVKKYGEQWDFCTCIVKSDSVNTALMEAPDALFDKVMERSEYIDSKCKGLLIQPNATPEERAKHEKRVKKCLKEAK